MRILEAIGTDKSVQVINFAMARDPDIRAQGAKTLAAIKARGM